MKRVQGSDGTDVKRVRFWRDTDRPGRQADTRTHLLLRVDQSGGDAGGVDAAIGVLVDLDVGLPAAAVQVLGAVEQVQDLLVVELRHRGGGET